MVKSMKIAFDNERYIKIQAEQILKRINQFDNKLYLEIGGKLFDDYHASRVLPGFLPDSKITMLKELKDQTEFVIVANANDIQSNKIRNDTAITYENEVLRLIELFTKMGLVKGSVVISRYDHQTNADSFIIKLKNMGHKVYKHYLIEGYPHHTDFVLSDEGFGKNEYIETTMPLILVTAPGPGSGKMATCLSQLYLEHQRGIQAGYAKFETFPIWNIPLQHPVNLAYEAATADLNDINMLDPYHLNAYNKVAVNYNRDIEVFPVLKAIFERIYGTSPYQSPTDMGVNMAGFCIVDEEVTKEACKQEIIRRHLDSIVKNKSGKFPDSAVDKTFSIMKQLDASIQDRACVQAAHDKFEEEKVTITSIQLHDGTIITGKSSKLLRSPSAALINALKYLAGIHDDLLILSPSVLDPIIRLKLNKLHYNNPRLHANEVLLILAVSATTNPIAELVLQQLEKLKGTQAHCTAIMSFVDNNMFNRLKIELTTDPIVNKN